MPLLKLSPIQSRFAASVVALLILGALYFSLTRPQFAYALESTSDTVHDLKTRVILDQDFEGDDVENDGSTTITSNTEKRQTSDTLELSNNNFLVKDIRAGETQNWLVGSQVLDATPGQVGVGLPGGISKAATKQETHLELRKRQSEKRLYVTINVCELPIPSTQFSSNSSLPQLMLYYSRSSENQQPGPSSSDPQNILALEGGYALVNITTAENVHIAIASPIDNGISGSWNYQIAASIDAPFHQIEDQFPYLHFVDADHHSALLITDDLTSALPNESVYQQWMELTPPYGMFAQDQQDQAILGLEWSYCGLMNRARVTANRQNVSNQNVAGMTNRGLNAKPKEQFYLSALNASSAYWGFLTMGGNSTASGGGVIGGGGKVWKAMEFRTKSETNCALMYNLTFCSEVAYAVPTNPDLFSPRTGYQALADIYDKYAASMYQYFNYSLQQIPCDTAATAQYSLARNCEDCASAYKSWLCAVTIPRCEDFTNDASFLRPRNVAQPWPNGTVFDAAPGNNQVLLNNVASNQSRNHVIDQDVKPGPYKEVLPCDDLCYDLVRSCPAALGFGCPQRGAGLEDSYGFRTADPNQITCSYLGAAYDLNGTGRIIDHVSLGLVALWAILVCLIGEL